MRPYHYVNRNLEVGLMHRRGWRWERGNEAARSESRRIPSGRGTASERGVVLGVGEVEKEGRDWSLTIHVQNLLKMCIVEGLKFHQEVGGTRTYMARTPRYPDPCSA